MTRSRHGRYRIRKAPSSGRCLTRATAGAAAPGTLLAAVQRGPPSISSQGFWFVAAVRERVRETELATPENGTLLSTILLVGGTVYIAVSAAAIGLADGMKTMSDDTYKHTVYSGIIHAAGDATYMMIVTGGAAMAAFIFAASLAIRRSAILPSWLGVFGYVAAAAALFSVIFFTMLLWLLWIAVASVTLFVRTRQAAAPRSAPAPAA
jgi:hypothetical protein